jgi:hypothetical protein
LNIFVSFVGAIAQVFYNFTNLIWIQMGIIMEAILPSDAVFFGGEPFTCTIKFTSEIANNGVGNNLLPDNVTNITEEQAMTRTDTVESFQSSDAGATSAAEEKVVGKKNRGLRATLSIDTFKNIAGSLLGLYSAQPTQSAFPQTPATIDSIPTTSTATAPEPCQPAETPAQENEPLLEGSENGDGSPVIQTPNNPPEPAPEAGGLVNLSTAQHRKSLFQREITQNSMDHSEEEADEFRAKLPRLKTGPIIQKFEGETIAWSFAQIVGQFVVDPHYMKPSAFDSLRAKIMYKTPGSNGLGGGGSMGDLSSIKDSNQSIIC